MAKTFFWIAVLSVPVAAADRVSSLYAKQVDLLESDLVRLVEAMPADKYDFRPTDGAFVGVRTFGEQVKHTATMIYMTAAIVLEERSPYGPGRNDNGPDDIQGKSAIVAYLKGSLAYARKAMASLSEKNQLDPLTTYFGSQPRVEVAAGITYHRSPFDRYRELEDPSAMSESALRGSVLFFSNRKARCISCHRGPNLDGGSKTQMTPAGEVPVFTFHNTGLYNLPGPLSYPSDNLGLYTHTGKLEDVGKFRVPTLRNIALTASFGYQYCLWHRGESFLTNYASQISRGSTSR